jgi:hypothetical protein
MLKKLFLATVAAFAVMNPVSAQVSGGDQDVDHNVDWKSPKWVAPKTVETWTLNVWYQSGNSWTVYWVATYPSYDSCDSAITFLKAPGSVYVECVKN